MEAGEPGAGEVTARQPGAPAAAGRAGLVPGLLAVSLIALNLRTAVVAVSPLLGSIQSSLGLSGAVAGLLTTVPDLCFGVFAVVAPLLGRRLGLEPALATGLALLATGSLLRLGPGVAALFAGTLLAGVGAALGNVLLPALVKRDHAGHIGLFTGTYTMVLSAGAALAAGVAVPLQHALGGWRPSLASWAIPALMALVVALATGRRRGAASLSTARVSFAALHRDRTAWALTAAMGLQSLLYYSLLAWMPTIFEHHGATAGQAGLLLSINGLVSIPAALLSPLIAGRLTDQRPIVVAAIALSAAGLAGLTVAPGEVQVLWAALLGAGTTVAFALSLTLLGLRSANAHVAAGLSSMVQGYGYLLAAGGPFLVGLLRDATGGFTLPLALLLATLVPQAAAAWRGARAVVIELPLRR